MAKPPKDPSTATNPATQDDTSSSLADPSTTDTQQAVQQKYRWSGGSWKGKTAAVAQIAKESISAASSTHSPNADSNKSRPAPATPTNASSKRLSDRFRTPSKSSPTTKLFVSSDGQQQASSSSSEKALGTNTSETKTVDTATGKELVNETNADSVTQDEKPVVPGWRGWWAGSGRKEKVELAAEPQPNTSHNQDIPQQQPPSDIPETTETTAIQKSNVGDSTRKSADRQRASWFGLWGSAPNEAADAVAQKSSVLEPTASNIASDGFTPLVQEDVATAETESKRQLPPQQASSWAFWSWESSNNAQSDRPLDNTKLETGQLAVANTETESNPEPTQLNVRQQKQQQQPSLPESDSKKRQRPESAHAVEATTEGKKQKQLAKQPVDPKNQKSLEQVSKSAPVSGDEASQTGVEPPSREIDQSLRKKLQKLNSNQLLPTLHDTFHKAESPSYFQQLFRLFGRGGANDKRHLSLTPAQPKIRKALAIGVHGYFPGPLIARVIGQPTGTSLRFANGAAAAIQKWAEETDSTCEIEKIALEGEGMIDSRVDTLWKLLLNWIDHIRNADFIMIACHSQGVPVSVLLLARLISFGCLNTNVRLGMCAMAGINLGPFPSYQSRILGTGTTSELFEFSRTESVVSRSYASALAICLKNNVRIVYVGSIDDQLVSLESALFTNANHPYIYRAIFIDGRIHAPGFLTSLVGLACKLRNLGVSDHGLIRELSGPLAGSLYTGEGHSRIYEDQAVYELAVHHALETCTLSSDVPLEISDYETPNAANSNPYFLPWAMRGVLEEEFVRTALRDETEELLLKFESWKPSSKVLKDVKFRLEAVRSKL